MTHARVVGALMGSVALALALSGCGPSRKPGGGSGRLQIAVLPKGTSQSYWLAVKAGAEAAAKEENADITWQGPDSEVDVSRQIQILQNAVTSHKDGIVLAACNATSLVPYVADAQQAGIPVVTIDSGLSPDKSQAFLATDNVKGGEAAADALARALGGKGKVGLIPFIKGAGSSDDRENGFRNGIKKYPGIILGPVLYCDAKVDKALDNTKSMLASTPDLAGIFAANQAGAEGAIQALATLNKKNVKLVCFDASQPEIDALNSGLASALVVQNPYRMGYDGVKTVIKAIRKQKIDPHRIDTGVTTVTKENINTPEIQKLLNPTK